MKLKSIEYNNLISVVIPLYNHEKYIKETVQSIVNQSYLNLELIVYDDGSFDNSQQVIKDLQEKYSYRFVNFKVILSEHKGIYASLNTLLLEAKGQFLFIIASDDVAESCAIEKLYKEISRSENNVLAVGDSFIIDEYSQLISWDNKQNKLSNHQGFDTVWSFFKNQHLLVKLIDKYPWLFGWTPLFLISNYVPNGYLIRSSTVKQIPSFTDQAPFEDWFLHFYLSQKGKFCFLKEPIFRYRWHSSNTIKNKALNKNKRQKTREFFLKNNSSVILLVLYYIFKLFKFIH